jgi:hypothetical protein
VIKVCMCCGHTTVTAEKPGLKSHGVCTGFCERVYSNWLCLSNQKLTLAKYYESEVAFKREVEREITTTLEQTASED